jgi:hypothetical protein
MAPFIVSRLAGHASGAFTLGRYGHWTQDHFHAARAAATGMYGEVRPRTGDARPIEVSNLPTRDSKDLERTEMATRLEHAALGNRANGVTE